MMVVVVEVVVVRGGGGGRRRHHHQHCQHHRQRRGRQAEQLSTRTGYGVPAVGWVGHEMQRLALDDLGHQVK